jgi:N-acetyl-gamma-glutamyl-phosphate reductase
VNVAVHGARGYLGRELMRLLSAHTTVELATPVSRTKKGAYGDEVPALRNIRTSFSNGNDADVWFLAVPNAEAVALAAEASEQGRTVIDLSRAHRHAPGWHYGIPGIQPVPPGATRIANPGCYPTAFAYCHHAMGSKVGPIIVDGKSGASGAGIQPNAGMHYPEMNESTRAYKVIGHDHESEMSQYANLPVKFTPHLVPQTRGLLVTVYAPISGPVQMPITPAVAVTEPNTGLVRGTSRIELAVTDSIEHGLRVGRCAIDNLLAGGAGTAIRNWNQAMGLNSEVGLCHT